jgi:tetratricopeptide (TPR) repeat protein
MTAGQRNTWIAALAIVGAGIWAYSTSFSGVFVFDDLAAIVRNPHIRALSTAMTTPPDVTVSGRPVASLTFALNYALAPGEAREVFAASGSSALPDAPRQLARNLRGYHAANLAIHLATALVLFGLVRRTIGTISGDADGGWAIGAAAATSLIWVVHPLTTSAVTYIVQRVESLMTLFYLLTLYCAIRAFEQAQGQRPKAQVRWWVLGAIASCALGMGTKETMVSAPIALALWHWIFGPRLAPQAPSRKPQAKGRSPWALGLRPWAFLYAGLAATWIILIALVSTAPRTQSVGWTIAGWTPLKYLMTQAGVLAHYVKLVFFPSPLILDYGWPPAASWTQVALPAIAWLAALGATIVAVWKRRPAGFAAAVFFLVLAPSSSILPVASEVAAEHRMYLPLAAILALFVGGLATVIQRAPRPALIAGVLVLASVATLGAATRERNRDYASQEALWRHDITNQPTHARARVSYGIALFSGERYADAEAQLREAARLDPRDVQALVNLGAVLCAQGKIGQGIPFLEQALAIDAKQPDALATLGDAYTALGQDARAVPILVRALEARPDDVTRLNRLGWLLATSKDDTVRNGARATQYAQQAIQLTEGRDLQTLNTLAAAFAETGRFPEAVQTMVAAVALAERQGLTNVIPELQRRRAVFESRQPLRFSVR